MRCPFCGGTFTLQGPFCPHCGRRIIGPDTGEPGPTVPSSQQPGGSYGPPAAPVSHSQDDVLVVEVEPEPAPRGPVSGLPQPSVVHPTPATAVCPAPVDEEHLGKTCPYCRFPLKVNEQMVVCPACRVAHHTDCWQENGGCTTYACRLSPESRPPEAVAAGTAAPLQGPRPGYVPRGPLLPPDRVAMTARLEASATTALTLSLLSPFCCGILSFVAVPLAIWVLARMKVLGVRSGAASGRAIGAIVVGVGVILAIVLWTYVVAEYTGGTGL
ncbi:MAG: hypothetical protein N2512_01420 [Armatimonadetes bacterium]|nr:hypothetical protein [Armatimonadota bacterium]